MVRLSVSLIHPGRDGKDRRRLVAVPTSTWDECGEALGAGISSLDFPSNSIVLIEVIRGEGLQLILPPLGSSFHMPSVAGLRSPGIDEDLVRKIFAEMRGHSEFSSEAFSDGPCPFLVLPLVLEAARIRRRGTPCVTPLTVAVGDDPAAASLGRLLASLVSGMGLGVVVHLSADDLDSLEGDSEEGPVSFVRSLGGAGDWRRVGATAARGLVFRGRRPGIGPL
jgi:hypothetical protein